MKVKARLLAVLVMCLSANCMAADRVKGDGNPTTKKISVDDYNEVRINGVIDFNYEQAEKTPTVEVTVDQNLHPYVNIEVKDRVLMIGFKGAKVDHFTKFVVKTSSKWLRTVKVSGNGNFILNTPLTGDELTVKANANSLVQLKHLVTVGRLDLDVSGSANMVADDIKVNLVQCNVDGSGSVTLKAGTAKEGRYSIVSSGDIHAFGVAVPDLTCKITGNGLAEVHATDNLKANVIGKGNIRYKGPTAVQQKVLGKGSVEEVK